MGGSNSKLTDEERRQRERERLLREQGVLIPPFFAVALDQGTAETCWWDSASRTEARYYDDTNHTNAITTTTTTTLPSSLSWVWQSKQEDASYRILQDYMQPGVWFQSVSDEATVLASLLYEINNPQDTSSTDGKSKTQTRIGSKRGRLLVGRSLLGGDGQDVNLRLQGGTEGLPRLASNIGINDSLTLGISTNQHGQGWLSGRWTTEIDSSSGDDNNSENKSILVDATAVLPWDLQKDQKVSNHFPNRLILTGSIGTGRNGWRLAADTRLQLNDDGSSLQAQDTRLFGSVNLQESTPSSFSPVQLSLELNETMSAVALTQRIAFDRLHFNIVDDRVPYVRNTAGWTLRMEQPLSSSDEANVSLKPRVVLGGVWQFNRALAVKATIQDESVTGALVMKRWKHPRVTCSLLGRYHWPSQTGSFLGVGVEIETGRLANNDNTAREDSPTAGERSDSGFGPIKAPPTRVALPRSVNVMH